MKSIQIVFRLLMMAVGIASVFAGDIATVHAASVPVLVKDINTTIKDNSGIGNLAAAGSRLYFTAWDRANGRELWKSDGNAASTVMVKDIYVGTGSGAPSTNYLTYFTDGYVYFSAVDVVSGWSFWRSNGTDAGTTLVKAGLDAASILVMNGKLYLTDNGSGLWQSDGTPGNTVEIMTGISSVGDLTVVGNLLYFTVGYDLWRSDGTTGGTFLLATGVDASRLTAVGTTLFFRGTDNTNGYELWKSTGTPGTTVMVEDIYPGDTSSNPDYLTNLNGTLYFKVYDDIYNNGLWKCTETGTPTLVTNAVSPSDIINVNGTLYFNNANDLWKSNGTAPGTVLVKADIYPDRMVNVNDTLFFEGWSTANHYELWKSNGTEATTIMLKDINPGTGEGNPNLLTNVNGTLYFIATEPATGTQLWKSDGTPAGTVLVQNVSPGTQDSPPANFANVGGTLFFSAFDGDDTAHHGTELWQTNGTLAGTSMVQDIYAGWQSSNPKQITDANGTIYFIANSDQLWKRVGTGTAVQVKDNAYPDQLTWVSGLNLLFFEGWTSADGYELWKSDGTTAGTGMIKNIYAGGSSSSVNSLTSYNSLLYFIATEGSNGAQLWRSDGTADGTVIVRSDIRDVKQLVKVGSKLFFVGDSYSGTTKVHDDSLWVIDGATGPTEIMWGIWPTDLTAVGSTLFFQGQNGYGTELWKSDGTQGGTVMVKDIHVGGSSNPENLTNVNGTLYFTVWNSWTVPTSIDIWKSDGSEGGTVKVKSLATDWSGYITQLTSVHGLLAFVFDDQVHGEELWTSDGTDAGSTMVKDIYPGLFGSSPANLTMANTPPNGMNNEALFFSAIDPTAGMEIYILDFTPPESAISSPLNNAYLRGATATISGSSSDSMPGTGVNLVEVSTDGATWHSATDTSGNGTWATWQYTWTLPVDGVYAIRSRATDLATNVQTPLASISVTVDNTLPVVTFSMPAVYHSLTVPLTFSATDNLSGIDRYCLTTTNSSASCPWTLLTPPSSYPFSSEGNNTLYAWAKDRAGNISLIKNSTTLVSLPHTLNIDLANDGRGSGSVYFQQKNATYNVDTAVTVYSYDPITLQATHSEYSLFGSWSGICTGAGDCNYTVPTVAVSDTITATATFAFDSGHAVLVAPHYFTTILGAYQADTTVNGDEIRIFGTSFSETLLFDKGKSVTLTGGDNQAHTSNSGGMTTVQGTMTIKSGSVTVDKITIRQ